MINVSQALGPRGATHLAKCLRTNRTLADLNLGWNGLRTELRCVDSRDE